MENKSYYEHYVPYNAESTASVAPYKNKEERLLWSEFKRNKKRIISELRTLVLSNPNLNKVLDGHTVQRIKLSKASSKKDEKRKWDLFLKYSDIWDDDLKKLAYLELKINYAASMQ